MNQSDLKFIQATKARAEMDYLIPAQNLDGLGFSFSRSLKRLGKGLKRIGKFHKRLFKKAIKLPKKLIKQPIKLARKVVDLHVDVAKKVVDLHKKAAPYALTAAAVYYGGPAVAKTLVGAAQKYQQYKQSQQLAKLEGEAGSLANLSQDELLQDPRVMQGAQQLLADQTYTQYGLDMSSPEAQAMMKENINEASQTVGKKPGIGTALAIGLPIAALFLG